MRQETVTHNIYKYDELSEQAKEKAREWYRQGDLYHWHDFNMETLKQFECIFPIYNSNCSYGGYRPPFIDYSIDIHYNNYYDSEDEILELSGVRLYKYIVNNYWYDLFKPATRFLKTIGSNNNRERKSKINFNNDCVLTGYCIDMSILGPIYDFLKGPYGKDHEGNLIFDKPRYWYNVTFQDLMEDCMEEFIQDCNNDWEYSDSEEYISENMASNDYEFDEYGNTW